jgi:hypothetical protein
MPWTPIMTWNSFLKLFAPHFEAKTLLAKPSLLPNAFYGKPTMSIWVLKPHQCNHCSSACVPQKS